MKKRQHDVETHLDINLDDGENVGGCREQESLYGNEITANKETKSETCTNAMDIDIN